MFEQFPELMDAKDVMTALHISRSNAYSLMRSAGFPVVHINGRKLVIRDQLGIWVLKRMQSKQQDE